MKMCVQRRLESERSGGPSAVGHYVRHSRAFAQPHGCCDINPVSNDRVRPTVGFVSFAALFNGCSESVASRHGRWGAGAARRAEQWCTDMRWQMADWRLSLWKETLGSQLVEGE